MLVIWTYSLTDSQSKQNKASLTYKNFIVMGDFDNDVNTTGVEV